MSAAGVGWMFLIGKRCSLLMSTPATLVENNSHYRNQLSASPFCHESLSELGVFRDRTPARCLDGRGETESGCAAGLFDAATARTLARILDAAVFEHGISQGLAGPMQPNVGVVRRDIEPTGRLDHGKALVIDEREDRRIRGAEPLRLGHAALASVSQDHLDDVRELGVVVDDRAFTRPLAVRIDDEVSVDSIDPRNSTIWVVQRLGPLDRPQSGELKHIVDVLRCDTTADERFEIRPALAQRFSDCACAVMWSDGTGHRSRLRLRRRAPAGSSAGAGVAAHTGVATATAAGSDLTSAGSRTGAISHDSLLLNSSNRADDSCLGFLTDRPRNLVT